MSALDTPGNERGFHGLNQEQVDEIVLARTLSITPCPAHGEGTYIEHCSCDETYLQASVRALRRRLDDQVKTNLQLKTDLERTLQIAESRRRKVAYLQREVDCYSLALKSVDHAVQQARLAMREQRGGRDRTIDTKSLNDEHERIIDADQQEVG